MVKMMTKLWRSVAFFVAIALAVSTTMRLLPQEGQLTGMYCHSSPHTLNIGKTKRELYIKTTAKYNVETARISKGFFLQINKK